jgi:hypothetical protein
MAQGLDLATTQSLSIVEYQKNASRKAPREQARQPTELFQRRPRDLAVQTEKLGHRQRVGGVEMGSHWHDRRCSVPKSKDFARKAAGVHWPPSQYGRLDLGGKGSQCAFFGLAAMKAHGPTEAPGGLVPNRAQQRCPAHGGAGSH